jgi:hypothetical protein
MSSKIEGVPEGWELVRIGMPTGVESFIDEYGKVRWISIGTWPLMPGGKCIVRKIEPPKPVYVPWTYETCPLGVHVECLGARIKGMITGAGGDGARIGPTYYSYEKLLSFWQQLDGTPCGTIEVQE